MLRCTLLLLTVFASQVLFGQTAGIIHGVLVDAQSAVLAGAKVTAIDQDKAVVVRETTTSVTESSACCRCCAAPTRFGSKCRHSERWNVPTWCSIPIRL